MVRGSKLWNAHHNILPGEENPWGATFPGGKLLGGQSAQLMVPSLGSSIANIRGRPFRGSRIYFFER